jgi:hypothetical protein
MMDEARLAEKLERIEALFAGAATAGEKSAAAAARERILARLRTFQREAPPIEHKFSIRDPWARRLFLALLRRYELSPYRYPGQHRETIMVKAPKRFVDETLWPEFNEVNAVLSGYLEEVTTRVVSKTLHPDTSEPAEMRSLAGGGP